MVSIEEATWTEYYEEKTCDLCDEILFTEGTVYDGETVTCAECGAVHQFDWSGMDLERVY